MTLDQRLEETDALGNRIQGVLEPLAGEIKARFGVDIENIDWDVLFSELEQEWASKNIHDVSIGSLAGQGKKEHPVPVGHHRVWKRSTRPNGELKLEYEDVPDGDEIKQGVVT